jgi:hypothetical protein
VNVNDLAAARKRGPYYTEGFGPSRYLLRLPGEDKAKGRTRATTFIKAIEDDNALKPWLATMAVLGTLRSTAVRSEWQSLLTRFPDPWYAGDDPKDLCKKLVEKSQEAGGSAERRDTGTALHDILEAVGTGLATIDAVPDEWRPHVEAALALLEAEGFEIVSELCEQSVINTVYGEQIIGRFDLMLRNKATGRLHIGDYKTGGATWRKDKRSGKWLDGYSLSDGAHSAQMALYQGAASIIVWPENKWDACELVPMPEIDADEAVIIHLPSTEPANCSVRYLDLEVGRKHLELCAAVRAIRKHKPLLRRVGAVEPGTEESTSPEVVKAEPVETLPVPADYRTELVERVKVIRGHQAAVEDLALYWPHDVPTFRAEHDHTADELATIAAVLERVEARHSIPFLVKPHTLAPLVVDTEPATRPAQWAPPDEGAIISDGEYEALKASCAHAPLILDTWHNEATTAQRSFSLRGIKSERRAEIICAALDVAAHLHDPSGAELVDAALRAVAGIDRQTGMTVGAALGSLTIDEARRLGELARAFGAGEVQPMTDETGAYRFAA